MCWLAGKLCGDQADTIHSGAGCEVNRVTDLDQYANLPGFGSCGAVPYVLLMLLSLLAAQRRRHWHSAAGGLTQPLQIWSPQ